MGQVTVGSVTFPYDPPVPVAMPRLWKSRLVARWAGFNRVSEGRDHGRPLSLISSAHQGFLTPAQVDTLIALYESGNSFAISGLPGVITGGTAIFDPDTPPRFIPATPDASLYACEMHFLVA